MAKITMFILILFMAILLVGTVYAESPTAFGNSKGMVHKGSGGKSMVSPDVCKTPPETPSTPPGIPIPYPNIGMSSDTAKGTKKVTMDGNPMPIPKANFKASTGDEPGSAGNLDLDAVKPKAAVPYSRPLHRKQPKFDDNLDRKQPKYYDNLGGSR